MALELVVIAHDKRSVSIFGVGVWSLWENNPLSDDPAIREKAKAILIRLLEAAKILGADTVLAVPGYVGCEFAARPERIRYDIAYERCVKLFSELAKTAEALGVSIGIENVWNKFLLSPLEMKRFISDTGSSSVGVYFDGRGRRRRPRTGRRRGRGRPRIHAFILLKEDNVFRKAPEFLTQLWLRRYCGKSA